MLPLINNGDILVDVDLRAWALSKPGISHSLKLKISTNIPVSFSCLKKQREAQRNGPERKKMRQDRPPPLGEGKISRGSRQPTMGGGSTSRAPSKHVDDYMREDKMAPLAGDLPTFIKGGSETSTTKAEEEPSPAAAAPAAPPPPTPPPAPAPVPPPLPSPVAALHPTPMFPMKTPSEPEAPQPLPPPEPTPPPRVQRKRNASPPKLGMVSVHGSMQGRVPRYLGR